jgi:hypothetical protein
MKIDWSQPLVSGQTKLNLFQPSLQAGYTTVINDYFFVTVHAGISVSAIRNINGEDVDYGKNAQPLTGIIMGWRF